MIIGPSRSNSDGTPLNILVIVKFMKNTDTVGNDAPRRDTIEVGLAMILAMELKIDPLSTSTNTFTNWYRKYHRTT